MKRIILIVLFAISLYLILGPEFVAAEDPGDELIAPAAEIEQPTRQKEGGQATDEAKPRTVKEAIEALQPDDPRKARVELLTWKIKYFQEHLRAIELEYTGLCYKDRRHRASSLELNKLNRELRRLLLN